MIVDGRLWAKTQKTDKSTECFNGGHGDAVSTVPC